jgi:hypothetical protein
MKNTSQIIGVPALLTFAVLSMPPQQMFAHLSKVGSGTYNDTLPQSYAWKSLIISEIMADPSPPQGLPDVEYVELFNRSSEAISLNGWRLSDPGSSATLTTFTLQPGQYIALASKSTGNENANTMVVHLPSLNNSGDSLLLTDPSGRVIDAVNYTDDWYGDNRRAGGGWSLELIDPYNTCEVVGNWSVSDDVKGGTPGLQNSILASNPDVVGPSLVSVQALDDLTLRVYFNEKLATGTLSTEGWTFTPMLAIDSPSFGDSSRTAIDLHLRQPLRSGTLYSLSVTSVLDCSGNQQAVPQHATFALPERANQGDIVINELLFNPPGDGVDFVELFNASSKYISLNGWAIGSLSEDGNLSKFQINQDVVLHPGGYLAFTADIAVLLAHYDASDSTLMKLKLPSFPDDHGTVVILDNADSTMDMFAYSASMHSVFLRDPEGVSLERVSASDATNAYSNWASAGSSTGFATPGAKNSVSRSVPFQDDHPVQVAPKAFTPLTGQPNFTEVAYRFDQAGLVATVTICDSRGLVVRELANNVLLGTQGVLRWEGDRDDGTRVQSGYYMVRFQVFGADGWTHLYREAVAVSPRY